MTLPASTLSVSDRLRLAGDGLVNGIAELLGPDRPLRDVNDDRSSIMIVGPTRVFGELTLPGKRLQSKLSEEQRHFFATARALLRPDSAALESLDDWQGEVAQIVDQRHMVWHATTGKALAAAKRGVDRAVEAVDHKYDPTDGGLLLVPDTNALIHGAEVKDWELPSVAEFEIVLVPLVLSELDQLKTHREPRTRERAREVIRFIKSSREKGSLTDGVSVTNRSRLRAIAVEPRVEDAFDWLDASVPDDRMIASVVDVMRRHPRSAVLLVSGDINLQNKASFARLRFIETIGTNADA